MIHEKRNISRGISTIKKIYLQPVKLVDQQKTVTNIQGVCERLINLEARVTGSQNKSIETNISYAKVAGFKDTEYWIFLIFSIIFIV